MLFATHGHERERAQKNANLLEDDGGKKERENSSRVLLDGEREGDRKFMGAAVAGVIKLNSGTAGLRDSDMLTFPSSTPLSKAKSKA